MTPASRRVPVATGLLVALATVLGACGPSRPALSDPVEIVTAALASTEAARTVHLEVKVGGEVTIPIPGGGTTGTTIKLGGTAASADVDLATGRGQATFAAPGLLILSGEAVQIGATSYVRTSLGGPLFDVFEATDALPVDPTDATGIFDGLGDLLLADGVAPTKGDDVDCGGKACYTVLIDLSADDLADLAGNTGALVAADLPIDLPIDLDAISLVLTVRVEKDTQRLAGIGSVISLGGMGTVTIDVTASNWDQPMDISPPPADQIKPAT